jgi:hypothetical protein
MNRPSHLGRPTQLQRRTPKTVAIPCPQLIPRKSQREIKGKFCTIVGGVASPLLANLFLHYAFDLWVRRHLPGVRYARYADDAVLHCKSRRQAEYVLERIRERFQACKLELHRGKMRIVYCQDINRTDDHPDIQFTFLSYTFRPRKAVDRYRRVYGNFSPAVSRDALKVMRQTIRGWHLQLMSDKSLADLSAMFNPVLRGWQQYYGHFYGSALKPVWRSMNLFLIRWLMRKHKHLAGHKIRAAEVLKRAARSQPGSVAKFDFYRNLQRKNCTSSMYYVLHIRSKSKLCNRTASRMLSYIGRWGLWRRLDDGSRMS